MLETIVGISVSRWRLRQTDTTGGRPPSSNRSTRTYVLLEPSDRPPITVECGQVLDIFGTQQADPEMVERPQAIDSMGWK
jgi:hypothetical protein